MGGGWRRDYASSAIRIYTAIWWMEEQHSKTQINTKFASDLPVSGWAFRSGRKGQQPCLAFLSLLLLRLVLYVQLWAPQNGGRARESSCSGWSRRIKKVYRLMSVLLLLLSEDSTVVGYNVRALDFHCFIHHLLRR